MTDRRRPRRGSTGPRREWWTEAVRARRREARRQAALALAEALALLDGVASLSWDGRFPVATEADVDTARGRVAAALARLRRDARK